MTNVNSGRIRVFVGSDERGGRGERILNYGIRKHASRKVEMVYMAPHEIAYGHWGTGWNRGRGHMRPYSGEGHATNFTIYRMTIPEAAGYVGRAVYVDADQTVHADIAELQDTDLQGRPCAIRKGVIVFDCEHSFWQSGWWPRISVMKQSGWSLGHYQKLINQHGGGSATFDEAWDVLDGRGYTPQGTKLLHYTNMRWQPYHPFPDVFVYPVRHPVPWVDEVWWNQYLDLLSEEHGVPRPKVLRFKNVLKVAAEMEQGLGLNGFGRPPGFEYHFTDLKHLASTIAKTNPLGWRGSPVEVAALLPRL